MYALAAIATGNTTTPIIKCDNVHYALNDLVPQLVKCPDMGLLEVFRQWENAHAAISSALKSNRLSTIKPLKEPHARDFAAPILYPSKVVCTGVNFYDHLRKDMNVSDFDKSKRDIMFFLKHPRAVIGACNPMRYPSQSSKLDWEIEFVVVFGRTGRRIPVGKAMEYVAGYSVGLDLSARDWQFNERHFKQFDLVAGKSFDDSCPLGPYVVPAEFVDEKAVDMRLWVNGVLKQNSSTREMIWSLSEQIAELSQHMTIEAGDVLYTGSPAGIGMIHDTYLRIGDRVSAEIAGLGRLEIDIAADPDEARTISMSA